MGKKVRSKKKKRGSVSGSGLQICEGQINIQDCEGQINIQDYEGQINIQDCEGLINTQEFVTQDFDCFNEVENLSKCSPSFIHLKRLEWENVGVKMSLLDLDTLLDAAPILEELQLQFSTCGDEEPPPRITKLKKKLPKNPRPHLKLIEIIGFYFERWQVQIVLYLLKNAVELESMEIEKGRKPGKEINETDMKSLTQQVPPNVKFVIL